MVEVVVRCLLIFLGGGLDWGIGSVSSSGLPRRVVALRFLEEVPLLEGTTVVSAISAAAVWRAEERVCLEDIAEASDKTARVATDFASKG